MKRIIHLLIVVCCMFLLAVQSSVTHAHGQAREDKALVDMLGKLSEADGYTYQVSVASEMIGNAKVKEAMNMTNYQSRQSFIVYSRTEDVLLFLCEHGQFRVNYKDKEVFYAAFPRDPAALQEKKQALMAQFSSYSVESYFLEGATISGKTSDKENIVYKLSYPAQSMIRDMLIDYNVKAGFFNKLQYTIEKPIAGSGSLETGEPAVMRQKVTMDKYVRSVPPQVKQLLESTRDLKAYLDQTYKGYKIQQINL